MCLEETVGRSVDTDGTAGEIAEAHEEHATGNWRKVAEASQHHELGYLAKQVSKQHVEGVA